MSQQSTPDLLQTLVALEDAAWHALSNGAGADFYQRNLTPNALMVFPFGVLTREEAIEAMRAAPPWATYHIEDAQAVELTDGSAILTYLATAQRAGESPYTARMTTIFVNHDGVWQTAFHQQTPISE